MSQTTTPNGADVDVLTVFEDCISKLEYHYRDTRAVAPHAGAWIETTSTSPENTMTRVAPHAGAWIETSAARNR